MGDYVWGEVMGHLIHHKAEIMKRALHSNKKNKYTSVLLDILPYPTLWQHWKSQGLHTMSFLKCKQ